MMLFLCILLGLLWLFQVVFFEEIYKTVRINEIERSAQSIAAISELDDSTLNTYVGQIAQDHEVCTMILDSSGNILSTHDVLQDCTIHNMTASNILRLYANAVQQGGEKLTRFQRDAFRSGLYDAEYFKDLVDSTNTTMGESVIYTKIVSSEARGKDVIIILNTTISPVGSTIRTLQTELLLITAIMAALAALLSFLLAKRVAQPLAKMSAGARQLAGGNYDVHFDASGYREIAELSDSLNYASQELSKTGALQRELIANISHDLRTPLTMIEGYAEVMRDLPGENTPENVQIIIDEAKRLTSLVNDVLDISKIQSGTQTLTLTDFNITETIREVIGRFAKLTEQDGWIIDFHSDEEVMVNADRTRILQVIYNYINNAITHSGSDKVVQVTQRLVEHDGQRAVRIEVTDHGEGIAPDNIEHIWDRYYKVDKLHRRAQTGSGLGLSIVKGILEQHHARYGVESELGKGSTFWFEL
ncbi:MAG: HAMP domain-containing histidine kinase [Clostridia bacterium]|nr:HAMP domain-containing histidine kinase [Clostridia bacterium]